MKSGTWGAWLHEQPMQTSERLTEMSVAAEDILVVLEALIAKANANVIMMPARDIPKELFPLSYAMVKTGKAAEEARKHILEALGLPPATRLLG